MTLTVEQYETELKHFKEVSRNRLAELEAMKKQRYDLESLILRAVILLNDGCDDDALQVLDDYLNTLSKQDNDNLLCHLVMKGT